MLNLRKRSSFACCTEPYYCITVAAWGWIGRFGCYTGNPERRGQRPRPFKALLNQSFLRASAFTAKFRASREHLFGAELDAL